MQPARRSYSKSFKALVIQECAQPGASIASIALSNNLKRAAAIMSLIQSTRLNGHDPYAYLKDVLTRLPTQLASEIGGC